MTLLKSVRLWLLLVGCRMFTLGQVPDPAVQQACTLFKRTVFEEQVPISFYISDAIFKGMTIDSCHPSIDSHILIGGGQSAEPKEFPHMARLGNRNANNVTSWFCGGTLITNRLVLTAAHCLYSEGGEVNVVRLGELDFASDTEDAQPEDFGVRNATEHPDFKYPLLYNDIAVIQLDRAVNFSVYKNPACLPFDDGARYENFIAIGWGFKEIGGSSSPYLQKVQLKNFGNRCKAITDVEELPNGYNATSQICIGSSERKDTCNGDSGGPVLTYHQEYPCMYHVMGITSFGLIGCNTPNVPSFYTRVHFYLNWIKQEIVKSLETKRRY